MRWVGLGLALFLVAACTQRPIGRGEPTSNGQLSRIPLGEFATTDILLVVDDSRSMADKQALLAEVLQAVLEDAHCEQTDEDVAFGAFSCRSRLPITAHVGIITTSLAAPGAEACGDGAAHLVPLPDGNPFLVMEDWQLAEAVTGSKPELSEWLLGVGQTGCGFEAPLEAAYRFLVDPAPAQLGAPGPLDADTPSGIDEELLRQRDEFLRRDSLVLVVFLTDEDDCSLRDDAREIYLPEEMTPGTTACLDDPADACCRSCGSEETAPPKGCAPLSEDERCVNGALSAVDDQFNVRCFDQKRRFGVDYLRSTDRYVEAFTEPTLSVGMAEPTPNPLFSTGRSRDMVHLLGIVGVPWQLLATDESTDADSDLRLRSPAELVEDDTWSLLLVDGEGAGDAHLLPSIEPRPGLAAPDSEAFADPFHGHEYDNPERTDLQFSCTFRLPKARDCSKASVSCDCAYVEDARGNEALSSPNLPLCQAPDGSYGQTQYSAKAYPPPRLLDVLRRTRGVVGSICPKTLDAEYSSSSAYGYTAAFRALTEPLSGAFGTSCLEQAWPVKEDLAERCKVIEILAADEDCDARGRQEAPRLYASAARGAVSAEKDTRRYCELLPAEGDPDDPESAAHSCANDIEPSEDVYGYCLIDPSRGMGSEELVKRCPTGAKRRVRLVPFNVGRPGRLDESSLRLICL